MYKQAYKQANGFSDEIKNTNINLKQISKMTNVASVSKDRDN